MFTPLEMAAGTHFHTRYATETTPVFLPADCPSLVSLLSGGTVQAENTYFCIFKVTGQVWES